MTYDLKTFDAYGLRAVAATETLGELRDGLAKRDKEIADLKRELRIARERVAYWKGRYRQGLGDIVSSLGER